MAHKRRMHPITGKEQILLEPKGLPPLWTNLHSDCERCAPFNECLGFKSLSDEEWKEVSDIIRETGKAPLLKSLSKVCGG